VKDNKAEKGDVYQINPDIKWFGGAFMLVTKPKPWGAQGFVHALDKGRAYYRCKYENMEYVGPCVWIPEDDV